MKIPINDHVALVTFFNDAMPKEERKKKIGGG